MPAIKPIRCSILLGLALLHQAPGQAQVPAGGTVVGGAALIAQPDASHQVITQTTPKAIIDWQNFSIGSGSQVRFSQPTSSSVMLNRVTGSNPSNILGSMSANGQIFLVNPNGVYFGAGASVDVAGLVATTLNIRNDDFMAGRYVFTRDLVSSARREVINAGVLKARENGYVVLAGDYAANSGVIQARLGTAALASGSKMTLDIKGDSLINFTVNEKAVADLSGVENSGQLMADGGRAIMTASVARELATTAVNNSGVVQARTTEEHDGAIYLAADGGNTLVSGTMDARGTAGGQKGGTIEVVGDKVALVGNAQLDASGDAGGGNIRVGGNYQGSGPLPNAQTAYVGKDVQIKADATGNGNGGEVVIWSDRQTRYYGDISAKGGALGGDGGSVEVSGKEVLDFNGTVGTQAPKGKAGKLLLDPTDIEILTAVDPATADMTGTSPFQDASNNGGTSRMSVGALEAALNAGNVTVRTTSSGTAPKGGTITIDDGIGGGVQWSSATGLTLQADNQILIKSHVQGTNANSSIWLNANNGGAQSPGTNIMAGSLLVTGGGNWDLAGVGNTGFVNSYNDVNTIAANISGGGIFRFANNKNLTVGTVNGVSGINRTGGDTRIYLDRNNAALQLADNITTGSLIMRAAGGINQTGGAIKSDSVAATGGAVNLGQSGNQIGTFAASINGSLNLVNSQALTVGSAYGYNGINTTNGSVSITTGDAIGYDPTKLPDGTNPASLTLNESITTGLGGISLTAGSGGVYQRRDVDGNNNPLPNGSLTTLALVLRSSDPNKVTPFVLNNANNRLYTLAASVNGSVSYTGGPLTVGSVGGVTGITTTSNTIVRPAGTDSSGRPTPAVYNDNNVSLSIGGDLNINENINAATTTGSGSVSIGVGGDFTAVTAAGKRINANTLGVFGDDMQGRFGLVTNVDSLAAAGGKVMIIDNSAHTGDLTGIGIGAPAASASASNDSGSVSVDSASKPVGDFYLTTGGALNIIKLNSKGSNLMLRADSLSILLDATTADGARIMLQPYHSDRMIGVNNATESGFNDATATNYSGDLLLKFSNPTATFFFGTPQNTIWNDITVMPAARNVQTGDIHIGYDGPFNLGYRSLSAQTSGNLVAYNVGPLYNLRLVAPNLTVNGFNTFGDQIHLFTNNLNLPSTADNYINPNKPTITLRPLNDETVWVGLAPSSKSRADETQILSSMIQKLPDWSTVVISGSTDYPFPAGGPGYGDIHIPWNDGVGVTLGHKTLVLSTGHKVYTYSSTPPHITKDDGGTSGGLWKGCQNLTDCKGTNPSPYPDPTPGGGGGDGGNSNSGDSSNSNNSNSGDCPGCPPAPPNKDPYPPDTKPSGGGNGNGGGGDGTSDNGTSSNNNGDNGAGTDNGGNGDNSNGTNDDSNSGNPTNSGGDDGAGTDNGGDGTGNNGDGTGDNGNGNDNNGNGTNGDGAGDNGAGTDNGGTGDGSNGDGTGDTGNGDGSNGNGTDGNGNGDNGAGTDNGGAGDGDSGNGAGDTGNGDGGNGNGTDGNGAGDNGAGTDNGGAGDGNNGNGAGDAGNGDGGNGNGSDGSGGGDNGAGTDNGGAGDGNNGNGAGDKGDGNGSKGDGTDGNGAGDNGTGTDDGGAGDGNNGNGAGDNGNGSAGGGTGDDANAGGDSGAGTGSGGASDDSTGAGRNGSTAGGIPDNDGGSGNGEEDGGGDAGAGTNSGGPSDGTSSANGGSADNHAGADAPPAVDLSCDAVANAANPDAGDSDQSGARRRLVEVKRNGVNMSDPCQKQAGQDGGK